MLSPRHFLCRVFLHKLAFWVTLALTIPPHTQPSFFTSVDTLRVSLVLFVELAECVCFPRLLVSVETLNDGLHFGMVKSVLCQEFPMLICVVFRLLWQSAVLIDEGGEYLDTLFYCVGFWHQLFYHFTDAECVVYHFKWSWLAPFHLGCRYLQLVIFCQYVTNSGCGGDVVHHVKYQRLRCVGYSQTATHLLHKDDTARCGAKHQHSVDSRYMHTLIQYVYRKHQTQTFTFVALKLCHLLLLLRIGLLVVDNI